MFKKLSQAKELMQMKSKMEKMKKKMEKITVEVTEGDYKIIIKGDQTIDSIYKNEIERKDLKKLFNKAIKASQKKVAKKMRGSMSDIGLPDI